MNQEEREGGGMGGWEQRGKGMKDESGGEKRTSAAFINEQGYARLE